MLEQQPFTIYARIYVFSSICYSFASLCKGVFLTNTLLDKVTKVPPAFVVH